MLKPVVAIAAYLLFGILTNVAAQTSDKTVKVGVLTDMSSTYADLSGKGSVLAAKMAVEDFGSKVLGNPIELVSGDHQQKADVAASLAREWYERQGVDVIVDLPNSGIALAVQNIARNLGRVSIISSGSADVATNKECSPTGAMWTYDNYSSGRVLTSEVKPGSTWFFLTVDSVGGTLLQKSAESFIQAAQGKVVGTVRFPSNAADMSSFLLKAQASKAQYIAMAGAGTDTVKLVHQAREFGVTDGGQKLVGLVVFLTDLKAMGLEDAQGLTYSTGFFPNQSPEALAWSKRFQARNNGAMPNDSQAGVYSAVLHYLKAVQAANSKDAKTVMARMRDMPVNDMFARNGKLREDGRMVHDMYLVQVKKPSESSNPWDLLQLVRVVPGDQAFRPLSKSECPLLSQNK
ncbi:ABC transporter substrate-binding protein [Caballeronia cordobensis]|uniref:ABC transporter substrate-binding protein n=1 Tax=Caballeronia cordobensis TaxID=1353886 RepID=UPI00045F0238|nr:putative ABC transport protein substrate-binding component [Burkholderia sp. RPE67]